MIIGFLNKQHQLIDKIRWCFFVALAIMLISFVILMGLLRLVLPYLTSYEKEIEEQLQAALNYPVQISRIDAGWHWFSPQLKLKDVNVLNRHRKSQLVRFDEVVFEFNVIDSLLDFKFEPSVITLRGTHLSIERNKKGDFFVQDVLLGAVGGKKNQSFEIGSALSLLSHKELRLQNTTITWLDKLQDSKSGIFKKINVAVKVGDNEHKFRIETLLPEKIGKRIQLTGVIYKGGADWFSSIYLDAEGVNVESLKHYINIPGHKVSSKLNTKLWIDFKGRRIEKAAGEFEASNLKVVTNKNQIQRKWSSKQVSSNFQLERVNDEWDLVVDELNLQFDKNRWHDVYFSLTYKEKDKSLDARFDYLDLSDLAQLASSLSFDSSWLKQLGFIDPKGELRQTHVHIEDWNDPNSWLLSTHFKDLGLSIPDEGIRVDGASGSLSIGNNVGDLQLTSQNIKIKSNYFNKPLLFSQLTASIDVHKDKDNYYFYTDSIYGKAGNVDIRSRVKYELSKKSFLDMQIDFEGADVSWFNQHRTDKLFGKNVAEWLSDSLVAGNLKTAVFMFYGEINDYPFRGHQGVIQSVVDLEDVILKYQPDWPEIRNLDARFFLENENIIIDSATGYLNDSYIERAITTINLSGDPRVNIVGRVNTNVNDVDAFFKATPLKQDYVDLVQYTEMKGQLKTDLNIDIPLNESEDVNVSGGVILNNIELRVKDFGYTVKNTNGIVKFNNEVITSEGLTGVFNDKKATVVLNTVDTDAGMKTVIKTQFKSDIASIIPDNFNLKYPSGEQVDWKLMLGFNHLLVNDGELMSLSLDSDLSGLSLNFPKPFYKNKNETLDFKLGLNVFKNSTSLVVHYDDQLNMSMRWDDGFNNLMSDIQVMNGSFKDINDGINITAKLNELNVDDWKKALSLYFGEHKTKIHMSTNVSVNADIGHLQYGQYQLNKAELDALFDGEWAVGIRADELIGTAIIPEDFNSDRPLVMDFERFDLSSILPPENKSTKQGVKKTKAIVFSPKDIPALKIHANDFTYKNYKFDDMKLVTSRTPYGLTVHSLDVKGKDLALKVKGNWFSRTNSEDHSNFRIEIESPDVGSMLSFYKFTESVVEGSGNAVVDWQWAASPLDFDWKLVSGKMKIDIEDGQFADIEPGAGRLLGMFSLSALPKRFFLDFSDTFTKGYEFNEFTSSANFSQGNLYTNKTKLTGHAADVYFRGRIGLSNKDYDQVMSVVPRISSGVSGWIAVAQGAVIGLTAYIAQKMLGVDEAAKNQYHITGNWSDPVIKKMGDTIEENNENDNAEDE